MVLIEAKDYNDMSRKAANIISAQVIMKPHAVLGLATGSTPVGAYKQLVEWYNKGDLDFANVTSVNLDEYKVRVSSSVRWMPDMNRFRSLPEAQSLPQTKHSLRTARTRRSIQQRRRCWNSSQALPSRAACSARCTAARFQLWRKSAGMPAAWRFWKMS